MKLDIENLSPKQMRKFLELPKLPGGQILIKDSKNEKKQ